MKLPEDAEFFVANNYGIDTTRTEISTSSGGTAKVVTGVELIPPTNSELLIGSTTKFSEPILTLKKSLTGSIFGPESKKESGYTTGKVQLTLVRIS